MILLYIVVNTEITVETIGAKAEAFNCHLCSQTLGSSVWKEWFCGCKVEERAPSRGYLHVSPSSLKSCFKWSCCSSMWRTARWSGSGIWLGRILLGEVFPAWPTRRRPRGRPRTQVRLCLLAMFQGCYIAKGSRFAPVSVNPGDEWTWKSWCIDIFCTCQHSLAKNNQSILRVTHFVVLPVLRLSWNFNQSAWP